MNASFREAMQMLGTFGLGGLVTGLIMHRLNDGRLSVRAAWHPDPKLDMLFPAATAGVRLHLVNVGRRAVRLERAGALLRKATPLGNVEHWVKDFQPITIEPDHTADVDALDFTSFHGNIKAILVEDTRGRRFKVGWRNMRELRRLKRKWAATSSIGMYTDS